MFGGNHAPQVSRRDGTTIVAIDLFNEWNVAIPFRELFNDFQGWMKNQPFSLAISCSKNIANASVVLAQIVVSQNVRCLWNPHTNMTRIFHSIKAENLLVLDVEDQSRKMIGVKPKGTDKLCVGGKTPVRMQGG